VLESGVAAINPVTDLLNPAKASRRSTEQRAKPINRRELKNPPSPKLRRAGADCEVDSVFMDVTFFLL
jgi:hypothetical protein